MSIPDTRFRQGQVEEIFSDFPINLDKNPTTGNLAKVTNDEAVKRSLKNIIMTLFGEWPHNFNLGCRLYKQLFEPLDDFTATQMTTAIEQAVRKERRAQLNKVSVVPDEARNGYAITILFHTVRSTQLISLSHFVRRLR